MPYLNALDRLPNIEVYINKTQNIFLQKLNYNRTFRMVTLY